MKRHFYTLIISLFCLTHLLDAQPTATGNDPTMEILPPSPSAAALTKYIDFPVNYYSGIPQINIPIHSLAGKGISVPISLSYHAGGVKVDEVSSNVGLGWSLNAGGVINRTLRGIKDEDSNGYMTRGKDIPYPIDVQTNFNDMTNFADGSWDGQPDLFNFSFGGYSGKFVFQNDTSIMIIPHQNLKIDYEICTGCASPYTGAIISFTITTPNGTQYLFGTEAAVERSTTLSTGQASICRIKDYTSPAVTAWYLKRIFHPSTQDSINFYYQSKTIEYDLSYSESFAYPAYSPLNGACTSSNNSSECITTKTDVGLTLDSIVALNGSIKFISNNNRSDIVTTNGNSRLTEIQVKGKNGGILKSFKMVQSFIHSNGSTPSTDTTSNNRMYLDEIEEYSSTNVFSNEYKFEYHNRSNLPPRLSFNQDHWGYFNGENNTQMTPAPDNNTTTLSYIQSYFPSFSSANRDPDTEKAGYGNIKKITYPTGGSIEYEFEDNKLAVCDEIEEDSTISVYNFLTYTGTVETVKDTISLDFDQTVTVNYNVRVIGFGMNGAYVTIKKLSSGDSVFYKGSQGVMLPPADLTGTEYLFLEAGDYILESKVFTEDDGTADPPFTDEPEVAEMRVDYVETITKDIENTTVGGIRLKQLTINDSDDDESNNIIRTYKYEKNINNCSGSTAFYLGKTPKYFNNEISIAPDPEETCAFDECHFLRLSSSSLTTLSNYAGNIVGYREVWEWNGGTAENGKKYFKYYVFQDGDSEQGPNSHNIFLNTPTIDFSYKSGILTEEHVINSDDDTLSKMIYEYEFNEIMNEDSAKAIVARKLFSLPCGTSYTICDGENNFMEEFNLKNCIWDPLFQGGCDTIPWPCFNKNAGDTVFYGDALYEYAIEWYEAKTHWIYLRKQTEQVFDDDGSGDFVEVVTSYEYDTINGYHTMPIATIMTNSDDKDHKTQNKFVFDMGSDTIWTDLIERNMIATPIETRMIVDGITVDGVKKEFSYFDGTPISTKNNYPPLLHEIKRYEVTWDESGTRIDSSWILQSTVNEYESDGLIRKFTKRGWESEQFEWDDGLLTKKTFKDFQWQYRYYDDSRLISGMTHIDGQVDSFEYDGLQRLKKTISREGNVVTNFTYQYKDGSNPNNYVKSETIFAASDSSDLTNRTTFQYLDGLGRPIQNIEMAYSSGSEIKDVITATEYDAFGRPFKTYEPFKSNHSDGTFVDTSGIPYTLIEYEASPLNRQIAVTPPNWYATTTSFGSNTSAETIAGINFDPNQLLLTTIVDPNGNKTLTYIDKKGRTLLVEKTDSTGSSATETAYLFDDKDRVSKVLPPGSTLSDSELIYSYIYDENDNIISKKIPDQSSITYLYDLRNLATYLQDGNMADQGQWLHTQYDEYGRDIESGFVNTTPGSGGEKINFVESLIKTCYDGCDFVGSAPDIYLGKVRRNKTRILGTPDWLQTTFSYDDHGRVSLSESNHHLDIGNLQADSVLFKYDFADNITYQNRLHHLSDGRYTRVLEKMAYDHSGRLKRTHHQVDGATDVMLSSLSYTAKDQILEKNIGKAGSSFLQSLDYEYLENGFLTSINQPTLGGSNIALGACPPELPTPGAPAGGLDNNDLFYLGLEYDQPDTSLSSLFHQYNGNISQITWRVRGRERQTYGFRYDYQDRLIIAQYGQQGDTDLIHWNQDYNGFYGYDSRGNIGYVTRNGYYWEDNCWKKGLIDLLSYSYYQSGGKTTNRLKSVTEGLTSAGKDEGFKPGVGGDYTYDSNGNMIYDPNKDMDILYNYLNLPKRIEIEDCKFIEFLYDASGTKLRKTLKEGAMVIRTHDYLGGLEYTNDSLEATYHSEGRVYFENGTARYEYNLTDHLGNTRLTFTDKDGDGMIEIFENADSNEVLSESHYYPFGMQMNGAWMSNPGRSSKYLYNGKELESEFGLDWYAYGARYYDPVLGRFTGVDPISDQFAHVSTYNYAENEPIANIDLWGLQKIYSADGSFIGSTGPSNEEWVINHGSKIEWAKKVFANNDPVVKSLLFQHFAANVTKNDYSRRLYRESDLNQVYDNFATENKHYTDREVGFIVYESIMTDEDGNSFKGYQLGKKVEQMKNKNPGATLPIELSKIVGNTREGDWRKYSAIHSHPNANSFSGIDNQPDGGPRTDFAVSNDLGWAVKYNAFILLTNPNSDYISIFDGAAYNRFMEESGANKYVPSERNRQIDRAISKRKIGEN